MSTVNAKWSIAESRRKATGKVCPEASGHSGTENRHPKKAWSDWEIVLAMYIFRV